MNQQLMNAQRLVIRTSVAAALVLAGATLIGWHAGIDGLVQAAPNTAPMQYNAAIGFALCGLGMLGLGYHRWLGAALGVALLVLGLATLSQYLAGFDLGIDELMLASHILAETSHPGRMAPNAAVAFSLTGAALAVLAFARPTPRRTLIAELLGCLVGAMGVAALMGYLVNVEQAYGWADWTRMAPQTAVGFGVVGVGVFQAAWRTDLLEDAQGSRLMILPAAIGALAIVLSFWQALSAWQDREINARTQNNLQRLVTYVDSRLGQQMQELAVIGERWARDEEAPDPEWALDAARFLADHGIFQSVAWIDREARVGWVFPGQRDVDYVGRNFAADSRSAAAMLRAQAVGRPSLTSTMPLLDLGHSFLVVVPMRPGQADTDLIVGVVRFEDLFTTTGLGFPGYAFEAFDGDTQVFAIADSSAEIDDAWQRSRVVNIENVTWELRLTPSTQTVAAAKTMLPTVVFWSGLLGVALLTMTVHLAQISGRRASLLATANRALESAHADLERLALYDALTGLGNRNLFMKQASDLLALAQRKGEQVALLLFDLDGFKLINDTLGHEAGDEALCVFAQRLSRSVREADPKFRLGGDEFAVLLGPGVGVEGAATVAQKVQTAVQAPLEIHGERCRLGASTGVAVFPTHGLDLERLLRSADVAMYEAKHSATASIKVATEESPTGVLKALKAKQARLG